MVRGRRAQVLDGSLVLVPAIDKRNTTGYKNVSYDRTRKKFVVQVQDGGKRVFFGLFNTAEEAATAYARTEYGRADAAKLLQPLARLPLPLAPRRYGRRRGRASPSPPAAATTAATGALSTA